VIALNTPMVMKVFLKICNASVISFFGLEKLVFISGLETTFGGVSRFAVEAWG